MVGSLPFIFEVVGSNLHVNNVYLKDVDLYYIREGGRKMVSSFGSTKKISLGPVLPSLFSVQFSSIQFKSVQFSSDQFSSLQLLTILLLSHITIHFSSVHFSSDEFSSVQLFYAEENRPLII